MSLPLVVTGLLTASIAIADAQGECALHGSAINGLTGAPVVQAQISAASDSGSTASTSTDSAGRFCFHQLEAGKYIISGSHETYVSGKYGAAQPSEAGRPITVLAGTSQSNNVIVTLWPEASVYGMIDDDRKMPIPHADVRMYLAMHSRGRRRLMPVWTGTSDASGSFVALGLAPGTYYASARAPRSASVSSDATVLAETFFPSTSDPSAAAAITLRAGDRVEGIRVTVRRLQSVSVHGIVVIDGDGARPVVSMVRLGTVAVIGHDERTVAVSPNGSFNVSGVLPGTYSVRATYKQGNRGFMASEEIEVGRYDVEGVRLTAVPSTPIVGRVTLEGFAKPPRQSVHVFLARPDTGEMVAASKAGEDGAFALANVPRGRYEVGVSGLEENAYAKSITDGSADLKKTELSVAATDAASLQVVLAGNGGEVVGVVTGEDGNSVAATVVLLPHSSEIEYVCRWKKTVKTEPGGSFRFRGVAPGAYVVAAVQQVNDDSMDDPEYLGQLQRAGARIDVDEGARVSVQAKAIHAR
jgi:hypothetical protein